MRNGLIFPGVLSVSLALAQAVAGGETSAGAAAPARALSAPDGTFSGTVVEATNASRYTYVLIDTGKAKLWAAVPATEVKAGDAVSVKGAMPSTGFVSPTLKRTFDEIYFAGHLDRPGQPESPAGGLPAGHPAIGGATSVPADFSDIRKPEGGRTVAEIWEQKAKLSGKPVVVRGKVVKVIPNILDRTFVRLRDGTGAEGTSDLTVTTTNTVKVGDAVTASGTLTVDKDFGSGYRYPVIVLDATLTP